MLAALILAPVLVTTVVNVSIEGFAFVPESVAVNLGDTVRWTHNDSGLIHTATSTSGVTSWNSGNMTFKKTYQKVFNNLGISDYNCRTHTGMLGRVVTVDPDAPVRIRLETPQGTDLKSGHKPGTKPNGPHGLEAPRDARGRAVEPATNRRAVPAFAK